MVHIIINKYQEERALLLCLVGFLIFFFSCLVGFYHPKMKPEGIMERLIQEILPCPFPCDHYQLLNEQDSIKGSGKKKIICTPLNPLPLISYINSSTTSNPFVNTLQIPNFSVISGMNVQMLSCFLSDGRTKVPLQIL